MTPTNKDAATERPWRVTKDRALVEQDRRLGLYVADCTMTDEGMANAALIVEAVNSYDALRAAIETSIPLLETLHSILPMGDARRTVLKAVKECRAALGRAGQ